MLPLERHRLIVEPLGQHGVMRVNEIAQSDSSPQGNDSPRSELSWNAKGSNPKPLWSAGGGKSAAGDRAAGIRPAS